MDTGSPFRAQAGCDRTCVGTARPAGSPGLRTGCAGATNGVIGIGVTAFPTAVLTAAEARGRIIPIRTIPTNMGAMSPLGGVGVIHRVRLCAPSSSPKAAGGVDTESDGWIAGRWHWGRYVPNW